VFAPGPAADLAKQDRERQGSYIGGPFPAEWSLSLPRMEHAGWPGWCSPDLDSPMRTSEYGSGARGRGITLLELLVVVGIVSLLLGAVVVISGKFVAKAKKVKCISHLRTLHASFTAYVEDEGHWPQMPAEGEVARMSEGEYSEFWIRALEPYGANRDTWRCPSDRTIEDLRQTEADEYYSSYFATPFDADPSTPFRLNQPWVVERGDFHGGGGHILMPDGSISQMTKAFYGR